MVETSKKEVMEKVVVKKRNIGFRQFLRDYIFEGYNASCKIIDIILLFLILASVVCVILEAVPSMNAKYLDYLVLCEWIFTIIFTIEYLFRAISSEKPAKYIFSFFGFIDLISVLPLYVSIVFKGEKILQIIRILRLIRIFARLLRVSHQMNDLSHSFLHLRNHLMPNENVLSSFRPSRKKRLFSYFLILILMIASALDIVFNFTPNSILFNIPVFFFFSLVVLLFSFFWLLKMEYIVWSERYMVTNERIFFSKGIFHENFKSKNYQYITDISLRQTFLDKILNTGDLIIHTAGGEGDELHIFGISKPLHIKKLIIESVSHIQSRPHSEPQNISPGNYGIRK
jgi:membrane protein YdbS with pleckstrin-like domain